MGLWNAAGRWLAFAVGALLVILGANSVWHGLDIIQVERGWTGVIAGTMGFSAGVLTILLTILIDRVDALRSGLLAHRAVQAVDAVAPLPVPVSVPVPEAIQEPQFQPQPIEVAVEAPPAPPVPPVPVSPRMNMPAFSFRPFGKRSGAETLAPEPVAPIETIVSPPEPLTPAPAQDEEPPEPIRRYAPPQFRRPVVTPATEETPEPVAEPVAAPVQVELEVQQQVVTTIEEPHLPRVSSLPPLPPIEPEPVQMSEVEPPAPPPPPEPAPPHRAIADTHAWLEKALAGEEPEPALDWLRQRRPADEPAPERKVPSFMRRHAESAEDEAVASQIAQPAEVAEPAAPATPPSVVGRYNANGSEYTLYADGTIDAQTPAGPRHFGSMAELRAFLEQQNAEA